MNRWYRNLADNIWVNVAFYLSIIAIKLYRIFIVLVKF